MGERTSVDLAPVLLLPQDMSKLYSSMWPLDRSDICPTTKQEIVDIRDILAYFWKKTWVTYGEKEIDIQIL